MKLNTISLWRFRCSLMQLSELTNVQDEKRDSQWESLFFHHLTQSQVHLLSEEPHVGPDGWPYLMVETLQGATSGTSEPVQKILHWLSEKGVGLAVNPQKDYPDFVFTYGMIWNFRQTGLFYQPHAAETKTGPVEIQSQDKMHFGEPSTEYLPSHVRKILREFFRDQGFLAVKILMISQDTKHFDLAFSLESLGNPSEKEHQGILEALSWFLPPHYSLMLASEKNLPTFFDL